jgi:hypothetical protein
MTLNIRYPTTVVDDFYKNPDDVVKFALSLEYFSAQNGEFPGKRTKPLFDIDPIFHQLVSNKFISLFYDFSLAPANWVVQTQFQIIYPFNDNIDDTLNKAWIHKDHNTILAGIIYLNPVSIPDSGTSIYSLKPNSIPNLEVQERKKLYKNAEIDDNYLNELNRHTSCFTEVLRVNNIYNRLAAYDGLTWHGATNHHTGNDYRLSQVINVVELNTESVAPLTRLNQFNI